MITSAQINNKTVSAEMELIFLLLVDVLDV